MITLQTYENGAVRYNYSRATRKWHFAVENVQFIISCPGGKATADAVAKQIVASCKRTKSAKIDGIARKNIDKLLHAESVES